MNLEMANQLLNCRLETLGLFLDTAFQSNIVDCVAETSNALKETFKGSMSPSVQLMPFTLERFRGF